MLKKFLYLLPAVIFLALIAGVYLLQPVEEMIPTPTLTIPASSPTSTSVITSANTPIPVPTNTEANPAQVTPDTSTGTAVVPDPSDTPSPTGTSIPTLTPTATTSISISGIVAADRLNLRTGPSVNYPSLGILLKNDELIILRRTPRADWLEIKTLIGKIGWVVTEYIEMLAGTDIAAVPMAIVGPTPTLAPTNIPPSESGLLTLDLRSIGNLGEIKAGGDRWYIFTVIDADTVINMIFTPNVNFYDSSFLAYNAQFFIYNQNQIPVWPPSNREVDNFGAGSFENDRDGDYGTGEVVWRGGRLPAGTSYYLRIVNRSSQAIKYCLAPRDQYEWNCPEN
jgi:hypothetical protein